MIKRLLSSLREYRKAALKTPMYVMFEVILEVAIPFIMAYLIDRGIDEENMSVVLQMGLLLLLAAFLALFLGAMAGRHAAIASAGFSKNLRQDIFYHIQDLSFADIDKFNTSSLITRLTTDINYVQQSFQMVIRMAARSPIMLIFSLAAAISINARLSLIFLAMLPVLGIGLFFIIKNAFPIFRIVFKTYDKMNKVVQENLRGIRVVKSFNREDYEKGKFKEISQEIYDGFYKAERLVALNLPLMQFVIYASMILISWFGARTIVASGNNPDLGLSTGQLMSLMTYTMQILMSLMMFSMVLVMMTISRASAERIVEVLDERSTLTGKPDGVKTVSTADISFENVSFAYSEESEKPVLSDINLEIPQGQTVGIIGGTGSSKSSLIQLIPRLYDVTSGAVRIGGIDVRDYDLKALRDQVAVVLQKNVLFSGTLRDNLKWGDEHASEEEILQAARLAQAEEFINELPNGYDTLIEQGGSNVSGGQKQRLTIARALLKKPRILILDDSTSAVDTHTDSKIRQAMLEKIPDTTKLIIAQRIASIKDADQIIVMDEGEIVAKGTHDSLLRINPIYREVYESQVKGGQIHE